MVSSKNALPRSGSARRAVISLRSWPARKQLAGRGNDDDADGRIVAARSISACNAAITAAKARWPADWRASRAGSPLVHGVRHRALRRGALHRDDFGHRISSFDTRAGRITRAQQSGKIDTGSWPTFSLKTCGSACFVRPTPTRQAAIGQGRTTNARTHELKPVLTRPRSTRCWTRYTRNSTSGQRLLRGGRHLSRRLHRAAQRRPSGICGPAEPSRALRCSRWPTSAAMSACSRMPGRTRCR